jgi:hypothetical protein
VGPFGATAFGVTAVDWPPNDGVPEFEHPASSRTGTIQSHVRMTYQLARQMPNRKSMYFRHIAMNEASKERKKGGWYCILLTSNRE